MIGQSIVFEDAVQYERWMGVWSQLLRLKFINWFNLIGRSAGLILDVEMVHSQNR
ncbi:hypothetical protein N9E48_05010 [Paracoccaceae bacterium]|nr:hypothetical protein [Paracoccaceae bacterium]